MRATKPSAPVILIVLVAAGAAAHASDGIGHADPVAPVLLSLALVLTGAKIGGELAVRLGQPAVLGELLIGVLYGNLPLLGYSGLEYLETDPSIDLIARLGVIVLLFEVGLESTVSQMLKVGGSAFLVATLGVAAPFALGWAVGVWLLPGSSAYVHAFLGATLCATSVGITARVLQDLGQSSSNEARVILGAAVIDDVLGLVILAIVGGVIESADRGSSVSVTSIGLIVGKALVFLVGSIIIGVAITPKLFNLASRLRTRGVLLAVGLSFCFAVAWLSHVIGLAPIVGAFAAGLVLESLHYKDFVDRGEHGLEELVSPISGFLVPVFFVIMGMRTDLRSFADVHVLWLGTALTVAAILGKQVCSGGVLAANVDRLTVGIGMVPRGEVGLIFANIGLALSVGGVPILDAATYSAIVMMVIATTMATPPALRWSLARRR
jgi:Kef-type K+ transport system membrane component KefB